MSYAEIFTFALRGLAANKLRSALTTLGILIGVGAVILLVAVGNGSSQQIQKNIQRLGANSLTVQPATTGRAAGGGGFAGLRGGGAAGGSTNTAPRIQAHDLSVADAQALQDPTNAPAVKTASPVVTSAAATATYQGSSHSIAQFVGSYPSYFAASNKQVAAGQEFTMDDVNQAHNVMVVGSTVAADLFGDVSPIDKQVDVGGVPYTVVGLLKTTGGSGFQDPDDVAIAPLTSVQQNLTGFSGGLSQIVVEADSSSLVDAAQAQVTSILDQRHGIGGAVSADFSIVNQASLEATVSSTNETFTVLLGAVAGISLLVGGIGITNIMLVTVTERTREIGIRKAIGAPKGAILGQFIAEATVLSLVGGVLGVVGGLIGSRFTIVGVKPVIVPSSIALALGVSVAIGLFFGSYPANRAAKLRPIEALRHE